MVAIKIIQTKLLNGGNCCSLRTAKCQLTPRANQRRCSSCLFPKSKHHHDRSHGGYQNNTNKTVKRWKLLFFANSKVSADASREPAVMLKLPFPKIKTPPRPKSWWRFGGERWIRTTEVVDNRFTVCSLWPLGNLSKMELVNGVEPSTC